MERAAERVESTFGPIDIWINNAMASVFAPVLELHPGELRRVTEVTFLGCAYGTMAALRRMVPRDRGTIVQVGSALAYRGIPLQAAYCAAKHAIQGFTRRVRSGAQRPVPSKEGSPIVTARSGGPTHDLAAVNDRSEWHGLDVLGVQSNI